MKGTHRLSTLFAGKTSSTAGPSAERQDDLQRALALSAAEARLADMTEEERLEAAIAQSLAEEEHVGNDSLPQSSKAKRKMVDEEETDNVTTPPAKQAKPTSETAFDGLPPSLDVDAFNVQGTVCEINKLNGSLDMSLSKGWLKEQQRTRLRMWMLSQLAWHRVTYIRPPTNVRIVTPRYTATFGKDDTGAPDSAYRYPPNPFPATLARLRDILEAKTGTRYNAIIINYYADGNDSISYHSDDEAFLGKDPTIASISLGAARDFYLRRKAPADQQVPSAQAWQMMGTKGQGPAASRPTEKFVLEDGDLLIMRGKTQAEWEHSIPKRAKHMGGRINMTFRKVINVRGTNSE